MPSRTPLTREQRTAAATRVDRAFIVAAPGSGKTTVAAERFGVVRYSLGGDQRRVLGLSFTRSATWEFARRVRRRWGSTSLAWPHTVTTLDGLHCELVMQLLRGGVIRWPGGHTELTVLDTWRGQTGARYLAREQEYRRVATLQGIQVTSTARRIVAPVYGIGRKAAFDGHLSAGVCTHEEIRAVLRAVLARSDLRAALTNHMNSTIKAIVVDEIFDADTLDLAIVDLAGAARVPTTLIGDPWQAVYEFRGAQPGLVPQLVSERGYETFPVTESFRFSTDEMKSLAADLRAGWPVRPVLVLQRQTVMFKSSLVVPASGVGLVSSASP